MEDDKGKKHASQNSPVSNSSSLTAAATTTSNGSFLTTIVAGATGLVVISTLPFLIVPMLRKNALPYMNTPISKIKKLFRSTLPRHIRRPPVAAVAASSSPPPLPQSPPPLRFMDLGHGMGEASIEAALQGYKATGIELNPTLFMLSIFNAWRHRLFVPLDPRLNLLMGNLWKLKLHEQDVIMLFGVQSFMERLQVKVKAEAKDDALVVLYRFQLPLTKSKKSNREGNRKEEEEEAGAEIELLEVADEMSIYRVKRRRQWIKEDEEDGEEVNKRN